MQYEIKKIGVGFVVGLVALSLIGRLMNPATKQFCRYVLEKDQQEEPFAMQALPVDVITAKPETVYNRLATLGELKAKSSVVIKAELPSGQARIAKFEFKEGEDVKENDVLIRFEDKEYKGRYQSALGEKERAESEFKRFQKLLNSGSTSRAEYEKAKANYDKAAGELEQAAAQLEKTVVRAKFSGRIGIVENFHEGDIVRSDQPLVTLVDTSLLYLDMHLPSKNIGELSVGQTVFLKAGGQEYKGKVVAHDSVISPETRTLLVRAEIENPDNLLKPGMIGDSQIITNILTDVFTVPDSAIVTVGERQNVFSVERGRVKRLEILTSFNIDNRRVVTSGIKKGDQIVTVPGLKLFEGAQVKIQTIDGMTEEEWRKQNPAQPKVIKAEELDDLGELDANEMETE